MTDVVQGVSNEAKFGLSHSQDSYSLMPSEARRRVTDVVQGVTNQ